MTKKSQSRRNKDATLNAQMGISGKAPKMNREKSSRCWYELKTVHMRSAGYLGRAAELMQQYGNPVVLVKIAKNGDGARFNELQMSIPTLMQRVGEQFEALWDSHKDKKKLCLSYTELQDAFRIFEAYQVFDTDFFTTFQPIISELNDIFNKALNQLLEAQEELSAKMANGDYNAATDPTVVTDVEVNEVKLPTPAMDMEELTPSKPVVQEAPVPEEIDPPLSMQDLSAIMEEGVSQEPIQIDPAMNAGLIRPNL
jgi:hypothetical protein